MLVKRIHDSLDASKVPDSRRLMLIDSLFSLHASVLRGNSPEVELMAVAVPAAAESEVTSEVFEVGDTTLDSISLVASAMLPANDDVRDIMTDVADLGRGDWVEFVNSDGGLQRYRLAWVSPQRGILLFTNPQSPRALSITPAALALQIQRGEAAVISAEPLFDRAMSRALESLQAA
jgi:hypothetical protein